MSINKFEISILKDSNNNDAELDSMSVEVAKAFIILVESLTKIIENSPNSHTLKIEVHKGSVRVGIGGVGLTEVKNNFLQATSHQSTDKATVSSWRNIQSLLQTNGLTYNYEAIVDDKRIHLFEILKNAKPLKVKRRTRPAIKTQIEFIIGKLMVVGGKNANIHIDTENNERVVVDCSQEQADRAKEFLYKDIHISAWLIPGNDKNTHQLCNSYYHDDLGLFNKLRDFIYDFENANDEIESLEKLHFECRDYLDRKDYIGFRRFLNLFNHSSLNISVLHTILMLTTSFEQHPELKDILSKLNYLFETRLKRLNRKPKRAIEETYQ